MGKYMKKGKLAGEVAVMMDVSPLGVRMTRARTLALQRLKSQPQPTSSEQPSASYLELRSRRLQKPPPPAKPRGTSHSPNSRANPHTSGKSKAASARSCGSKKGGAVEDSAAAEKDEVVDGSFGENVVDLEARNRSSRETTPCNLIRDSETIRTPGSTTRPTCSSGTNRKAQNSAHRNIPTAKEMEEFFAGAEQDQQKIFVEKYNFDPVNDHPLPGRYEWVRLDP